MKRYIVVAAIAMSFGLASCSGSSSGTGSVVEPPPPPPPPPPSTGRVDMAGLTGIELIVATEVEAGEVDSAGDFTLDIAGASVITVYNVRENRPALYALVSSDGLVIDSDSSAIYLLSTVLPELSFADASTIAELRQAISASTELRELSDAISASVTSNGFLFSEDISTELFEAVELFRSARDER